MEEVLIFDANTAWNKRGKPAIVNLDMQGRITFSVEAIKLLGLKVNEKLVFALQQDDNEMIYYYRGDTGIPLRVSKQNINIQRLGIYCRPMVEKLLGHLGLKKNRSFPVRKETTIFQGKEVWFLQKDDLYAK
jgi:hypothetical protein